jgi:hypothetical protein
MNKTFLSLSLVFLFFVACKVDFLPSAPGENCIHFEPLRYISYPKDLVWTLSYFDSDGKLIQLDIATKNYEAVQIAIPPEHCTALLLSCDLEKSENFEKALAEKPWGFIAPFGREASEASTVASLVFFKLIQGASDTKAAIAYASYFNWEKLVESLEKQSDPFLLDIDLMATAIAEGSFTSKSIKKLLP